ncbi:MAG: hypothetical protein R2860_05720 [Desulfobacterales bacterium]
MQKTGFDFVPVVNAKARISSAIPGTDLSGAVTSKGKTGGLAFDMIVEQFVQDENFKSLAVSESGRAGGIGVHQMLSFPIRLFRIEPANWAQKHRFQ